MSGLELYPSVGLHVESTTSYTVTTCGIFYVLCLLHRHRIKGTNMLYSVSCERHMQCKRTCPSFEATLQQLSYHTPQAMHILYKGTCCDAVERCVSNKMIATMRKQIRMLD